MIGHIGGFLLGSLRQFLRYPIAYTITIGVLVLMILIVSGRNLTKP